MTRKFIASLRYTIPLHIIMQIPHSINLNYFEAINSHNSTRFTSCLYNPFADLISILGLLFWHRVYLSFYIEQKFRNLFTSKTTESDFENFVEAVLLMKKLFNERFLVFGLRPHWPKYLPQNPFQFTNEFLIIKCSCKKASKKVTFPINFCFCFSLESFNWFHARLHIEHYMPFAKWIFTSAMKYHYIQTKWI